MGATSAAAAAVGFGVKGVAFFRVHQAIAPFLEHQLTAKYLTGDRSFRRGIPRLYIGAFAKFAPGEKLVIDAVFDFDALAVHFANVFVGWHGFCSSIRWFHHLGWRLVRWLAVLQQVVPR